MDTRNMEEEKVEEADPITTRCLFPVSQHLKLALQTTLTLGFSDPTRPFTKTVDENNGCMTSVLLHGLWWQTPVAYFSTRLDPVSAGLPRCLRVVAAAEMAITAYRDIVGYSDITLLIFWRKHHTFLQRDG